MSSTPTNTREGSPLSIPTFSNDEKGAIQTQEPSPVTALATEILSRPRLPSRRVKINEDEAFEDSLNSWKQKAPATRAPTAKYIMHCFQSKNKELELSSTDITSAPDCISEFSWLTYLDLSENPILSFPSFICRLTALKGLNLTKTEIGSIPNSIENLKQLTELKLRKTRITSIPPSIFKLSKRLKVDLRECPLSIETLTRLTSATSNCV